MRCSDIQEKLSAYLDNELVEKELQEIKEHLASCERCRISLASLERTVTELKSLEQVEPPAWLSKKVMAQIREQHEKAGLVQRLRSFWQISVPVGAFATILVVGIALYLYRDIAPQVKTAAPPETPAIQELRKAPAEEAPAQSKQTSDKAVPREADSATRQAELKPYAPSATEPQAAGAPAFSTADKPAVENFAKKEKAAAPALPAPAAPSERYSAEMSKDNAQPERQMMHERSAEPMLEGRAESGAGRRRDDAVTLAFEFFDANGKSYRSNSMKEYDRIVLLETPSLSDEIYARQQEALEKLRPHTRLFVVVSCTAEEYKGGFYTTPKTARELAGGHRAFRIRILNGIGNVLRGSNQIIGEVDLRRALK